MNQQEKEEMQRKRNKILTDASLSGDEKKNLLGEKPKKGLFSKKK